MDVTHAPHDLPSGPLLLVHTLRTGTVAHHLLDPDLAAVQVAHELDELVAVAVGVAVDVVRPPAAHVADRGEDHVGRLVDGETTGEVAGVRGGLHQPGSRAS